MDRAEAFDRPNIAAVGLDREHQTGADAVAINDDRAGAANSMFASDVGTGQPQRAAQKIRKQHARLDAAVVNDPVDLDAYRTRGGHAGGAPARVHADTSTRLASTPTRWRR